MARTKDQPQLPVFTTVETVFKPNEPIVALLNQVTASLVEGSPVFIQDTSPVTTSSKWLWLHRDASGNWVLDIEDGVGGTITSSGGSPVFVQDTTPITTSTKWVWVHKDVYGNWILDVEDGKPGYSLYQNVTDVAGTSDAVTTLKTP